jgi:glycosyltransferase involved in cell wall biosynthesis
MDVNLKKVIVIVPAFNEEDKIRDLLRLMPDLRSKGIQLETVVVDDGSQDKTAEIAGECGAVIISHGTNQGLGKSFQDGLAYALSHDADIMVNIDADLQYNPADIEKLIEPILENKADFVTADRFTTPGKQMKRPASMPRVKYWGNQRMTHLINSLAGTELGDVSSGFRAMNREAIYTLNLTGKYTYTHETILDLAYKKLRLLSIPILVTYYPERKSKVAHNLPRYINQSLRIILKAFRDYKPFYFFGILAILPLVVGIGMLIFMLVHYIITGSFSPYKFIGFIGIYAFSLGLILLIIGFLADILVGIRLTAEKQLYLEKKQMYQRAPKVEK